MAKSKREQTPDILGNVLSNQEQVPEENASVASDEVAVDSSSEREEGEARASDSAPEQNDASAEDEKAADGEKTADVNREGQKRKATFYLTEATLSKLEEAWFKLRQMEQGSGGSVSKSAIVEVALRHVIADLIDKSEDSAIARTLLPKSGKHD